MSCSIQCDICDNRQKELVQESIPFDCKVLLENRWTTVAGQVVGRKEGFPHVRADGNIDIEISWRLAYRLLIKLTKYAVA